MRLFLFAYAPTPHVLARFLIFITVVVTVAMLVGNVYVLAFYAHPEDRNQAWFPKIVVLLGLTLAFLSVLMLPLDRANRNACDQSKIVSACTFTLPMTELWCAQSACVARCALNVWAPHRTYVYMTMICFICFVIPFTLFFYEADSDKCVQQRKVLTNSYG